MNSETRLLLEIWESVRDNLPASKRAESARGIVNAFADYGYDASDFRDVLGEDQYLTDAIEDVFGDDPDDSDGYDDEDYD